MPETDSYNETPATVAAATDRFVETAISSGTLSALSELNNTEPPLDGNVKEVVIFNASRDLVRLHEEGEDIGEAARFAMHARRMRGRQAIRAIY